MKLINIVNAYNTAVKMETLNWPFDMALALVKIKRAAAGDAEFFVSKERDIVLEYAAFDEDGNIRLSDGGKRFVYADPDRGAECERVRNELADTDIAEWPAVMRVRAPAEIRPDWIEALDGFIEFVQVGVEE